MRRSSATYAALMVSALVGLASPAHATLVNFNDVIDGGPKGTTLTGPNNSFSFTHNINDSINVATDTIISGTLTIILSDPAGGKENAFVKFDAGGQNPLGDVPTSPPSTNYTFALGSKYGGVDIEGSLQTDGLLNVEIRITGAPRSTFIFNSSTLSGVAEVHPQVPEPSSLFLLGAGLIGVAAVRRRRQRGLTRRALDISVPA
jgi:PEP-CTERM motif